MWTIVLLILMADGSDLWLGFNSRAVCEEVRAHYLVRPDVATVGECQ